MSYNPIFTPIVSSAMLLLGCASSTNLEGQAEKGYCPAKFLDIARSNLDKYVQSGKNGKMIVTIKYSGDIAEITAVPDPESGVRGGGGAIKISCKDGRELSREAFR